MTENNRSHEGKTISRAVPKKDTQAMIKALRAAGLDVIKHESGRYTCDCPATGAFLWAALPGRRNYLVRMRRDLFA